MNDSEYMIFIFFLQYHHRDTESYIYRYIVVAIFFIFGIFGMISLSQNRELSLSIYIFGDIELFNARISLL